MFKKFIGMMIVGIAVFSDSVPAAEYRDEMLERVNEACSALLSSESVKVPRSIYFELLATYARVRRWVLDSEEAKSMLMVLDQKERFALAKIAAYGTNRESVNYQWDFMRSISTYALTSDQVFEVAKISRTDFGITELGFSHDQRLQIAKARVVQNGLFKRDEIPDYMKDFTEEELLGLVRSR